MKKNILLKNIILLFICVMAISGISSVLSNIFYQKVRYQTLEESINKSAPRNSNVALILQDENAALVTVKKNNEIAEFTSFTLFKDESGWTSFKYSADPVQKLFFDNAYVAIFKFNGIDILTVSYSNEYEGQICKVSDNFSSEILVGSYSMFTDVLIVFENKLPDGYVITINDQQLPIN